jgi:hypothetical protein
LESFLQASQPLLIALRIADGDETPTAPEILAAMDVTKATVKEYLKEKPRLCAKELECFEKRWENGAKVVWSSPIFESREVLCLKEQRYEASCKAEIYVQ